MSALMRFILLAIGALFIIIGGLILSVLEHVFINWHKLLRAVQHISLIDD